MKNERIVIAEICRNLSSPENINIDPFLPVDWGYILDSCLDQKILLHVYRYLKPYISREWREMYEKQVIIHKVHNMQSFQQVQKILEKFRRHDIRYVLSKGFAFSMLIYDDPFLRVSSDVDILVHKDDYQEAACLLERLGYEEASFSKINPSFPCDDKYSYFRNNSANNFFVKAGWISVELKDQIQNFLSKDLERALMHRTPIIIQGVSICSFSIEDVFVNLVLNSYKNLCSPYGIDYDHRLSDIVDFYTFCLKHKEVLTDRYLYSLDFGYQYRITYVTRLLCEFYPRDKLLKLPVTLFKLPAVPSDMHHVAWEMNILDRFFDKSQRTYSHHLFRKKNYTHNYLQPGIPIKRIWVNSKNSGEKIYPNYFCKFASSLF